MTDLLILAQARRSGPPIDFAALSPLIALTVGLCVVLLAGLVRGAGVRRSLVPGLTLVTLFVTAGLCVWQWGANTSVISGALAIDDLTLALTFLFLAAGVATVLLSWRAAAPAEAGHGEYYCLLLASILGMLVLAGAQNLIALFLGFELLSIPLYVLCGTEMRRATSLESGLKYLVVGSVGSATLLYGLAFLYGATGSTDYAGIAEALRGDGVVSDVLFLTALSLIVTGLAFKASVAPFHQWTPDVYEGAPTPITAFMAVATKAAAFGVLLRLFDVALIGAARDWAPALAALAAVTIVIGNVGALGQSSLKRMLAYSSVAQAGYMLAGVVVSTRLGVQAVFFYLAVYLLMNMAAFAVIVARERDTGLSDDISSLYGTGASKPLLAWPMTIAMLSLAGFPATAGFFGKIYLIEAVVDNGYAWLGVVIVLGSAISLAYYLRVVAAVWMRAPEEAGARGSAGAVAADSSSGFGGSVGGVSGPRPAIAGGAPDPDDDARLRNADGVEVELDRGSGRPSLSGSRAIGVDGPLRGGDRDGGAGAGLADKAAQPEVLAVALICAAATIVFGIYPDPLFDVARDAGAALRDLL